MRLLILCLAGWAAAFAQQDVIQTLIGGGPNHMPALDADINGPAVLAFDNSGNYYIAAYYQNRVFKVTPSGLLTVFAGTGQPGYAGDGVSGGATAALLNGPFGLAVDSAGNVYISDIGNFVVRVVDTTNTINTIAGMAGVCDYNGEGSPATAFDLCNPAGLAADNSGNLYIADQGNCRVRKLTLATDTIGSYAGKGECAYSGDHGPATAAKLNGPSGVAVDTAGDVYISDSYNYRIRVVTASTGVITTVAGNGETGFKGDKGPAIKAELGGVYQGVWTNNAGTAITIADAGNNRVRQFTVGGDIASIAGNGTPAYCGDSGPAAKACLNNPEGLAVSGSAIYVADTYNNLIRMFTDGGNISSVAGDGSYYMPVPITGLAPHDTVLNYPWGVLMDASGNIYVADQSNYMVRELVQSSGLVDFFAGTGVAGDNGDNGPATSAELGNTFGLAQDSAGNIYIADANNCVIRRVVASGDIEVFAGTSGHCGYSGDQGPATSAQLSSPYGVFVDGQNNAYIADTGNNVVRVVAGGTITTFAGNGTQGDRGNGGTAAAAELNAPNAVAGDGAGNIYIADTNNCVIREVSAAGIIETVAGNGICGFSGDGVATRNQLYYPSALTADINGNLFIADSGNNRLRWVDAGGSMVTFAGTGPPGYSGDGGLATSAQLYNPAGIFEDSAGNFLVSDQNNYSVRSISAFAGAGVSARTLKFGQYRVGTNSPAQTVTLSAVGPLDVTSISASGDFSQSNTCNASLPNGQTCAISVTFRPKSSGTRAGDLTLDTNSALSASTVVSLTGTGIAISIKGSPVAFGNRTVNTTSPPMTVTVTNKGTGKVTMGTITLTETTDFAIATNTCPASGASLAGKTSCAIGLTFTPQSTGSKTGSLVIDDSDPGSPQTVPVSGTGVN